MSKYYDVVLTDKKHNNKMSMIADAFSVSEDRLLKIKSKEFGDAFVQIGADEELTVNEIELEYNVW